MPHIKTLNEVAYESDEFEFKRAKGYHEKRVFTNNTGGVIGSIMKKTMDDTQLHSGAEI